MNKQVRRAVFLLAAIGCSSGAIVTPPPSPPPSPPPPPAPPPVGVWTSEPSLPNVELRV